MTTLLRSIKQGISHFYHLPTYRLPFTNITDIDLCRNPLRCTEHFILSYISVTRCAGCGTVDAIS